MTSRSVGRKKDTVMKKSKEKNKMGAKEIIQNTNNDRVRRMGNQWAFISCVKEKSTCEESQDRETQGHGWEILCVW